MGATEAIAFARAQLGKPYVFGATGPNAYDCSGLAMKACAAGGVSIGRTTYEQIFNGSEVARADLIPGDLIFPDIGHVQLYVGNNMVIEAPHSGAFVREVQVWGFWRARRVLTGGSTQLVSSVLTGNPIQDLISKIPVLGELETLAKVLSSPLFWKRIGVAALGILVVLMAVAFINRGRIEMAAKGAAKAAEMAAVV